MKSHVKNAIALGADLFLLLVGSFVALICYLSGVRASEPYIDAAVVIGIIAASFLAMIFGVEVVSMFKISDSTVHTVYIALSALCGCLFTPEFSHLIGESGAVVPSVVFDGLRFASFLALILSLFRFWNYTYDVGVSRRTGIVFLAVAGGFAALYVGLSFVSLSPVVFGLALLSLAVCFGYFRFKIVRARRPDGPYYLTEALFFAGCGSAIADELCDEVFRVAPFGVAPFYSLVIVFLFALVYVAYAMRTDRAALQASEYKLKYEQIKAEALRAQIKPHFVFNSLAAIQSLYHKSLEAGDRATNLFSKHLRASVEGANTDFIPFERELDNVQVYVELENMRRDPPFNVIFDVEATDFDVPVLSLQPYIENAIRYSKVNEKPDGYVRISTIRTERGVVLEISDNGAGFDATAVPPTSCGIRNSRERILMLLGTEPKITSTPGIGTVVTVTIPDKPEEKA